MTTVGDPPWAFQLCPGCGRHLPLAAHELSCPCFDSRTRVAVAWICDDCDLIVDLVGLFTSWSMAVVARQRELDERAARYFSDASPNQAELRHHRLSPKPHH